MPLPADAIAKPASEIDFDSDGRRTYRVRLPYGRARQMALPLAVIRNGKGASVLLAGGTHGDEFEGQIGVANLVRDTDPASVSGHYLILQRYL